MTDCPVLLQSNLDLWYSFESPQDIQNPFLFIIKITSISRVREELHHPRLEATLQGEMIIWAEQKAEDEYQLRTLDASRPVDWVKTSYTRRAIVIYDLRLFKSYSRARSYPHKRYHPTKLSAPTIHGFHLLLSIVLLFSIFQFYRDSEWNWELYHQRPIQLGTQLLIIFSDPVSKTPCPKIISPPAWNWTSEILTKSTSSQESLLEKQDITMRYLTRNTNDRLDVKSRDLSTSSCAPLATVTDTFIEFPWKCRKERACWNLYSDWDRSSPCRHN